MKFSLRNENGVLVKIPLEQIEEIRPIYYVSNSEIKVIEFTVKYKPIKYERFTAYVNDSLENPHIFADTFAEIMLSLKRKRVYVYENKKRFFS